MVARVVVVAALVVVAGATVSLRSGKGQELITKAAAMEQEVDAYSLENDVKRWMGADEWRWLEEDGFVSASSSGTDGAKKASPEELKKTLNRPAHSSEVGDTPPKQQDDFDFSRDPRATQGYARTPAITEDTSCPTIDIVLCDEGSPDQAVVKSNFVTFSADNSIAKSIDLFDALRFGAKGEQRAMREALQRACAGRPVFAPSDDGMQNHAAAHGSANFCATQEYSKNDANGIAPALVVLLVTQWDSYSKSHLQRMSGCQTDDSNSQDGSVPSDLDATMALSQCIVSQ